MTRRIEVDAQRCTGCRSCMLACSLRRTGEVRLAASAIQVVSQSDESAHALLVCVSCTEQPCVAACPVGAIHVGEDTPTMDVRQCIGCRACVDACPYGAISFDDVANQAVMCDLCGGNPVCIQVCNAATTMPGALAWGEGALSEDARTEAIQRVARANAWRKGESST